MKVIKPETYTGSRPWDALPIDDIENASIKLHWTSTPYQWHVNDGSEVFVVLRGQAEMRTRQNSKIVSYQLNEGDIFHAEEGDEHVAHPVGEARVLVIERKGSI